MKIFKTVSLLTLFLFCVFTMGLISPSANADVADYWQKISSKKPEDILAIYQKRVANESSSSKFIKQSTIFLCNSVSYYDWKKDIIADLLAKMDSKVFLETEIKEGVGSFIQKSEFAGRYLSLKRFLEVLLFKNENLKKSDMYRSDIALKLVQTDSALFLYSDAESVFLNSIGEKNIDLKFWQLYSYIDLLVSTGKLDDAQGRMQTIIELAKAKDVGEAKYLPWTTLLESKLALQRNEVEKAYKKALEMKIAFEKLDVVRINPSPHPYYVFSIIARRAKKMEEALKSLDTADKIAFGKINPVEQFWYKLSRLKLHIKTGTYVEADLLAELNSSFQPLEKTEVEELYKVYKTQYQKLIQKTLTRKDVELAFLKNMNYFENQEILSFLSGSI